MKRGPVLILLGLLALPALRGEAATIEVLPLDGAAESDDGPWTLDPSAISLVTQRFSLTSLESRAVLEFDLGAIPAGSTILSATFSARVSVFTTPPNPQIEFHGYAGEGLLEADDAKHPFNLVGISPVISDLSFFSNEIDTEFVESFVGTGDHLGMFTYSALDGTQVGFYSVEGAEPMGNPPPKLTIEYVPEPSTGALLGLASLALSRRRRG